MSRFSAWLGDVMTPIDAVFLILGLFLLLGILDALLKLKSSNKKDEEDRP